jgi:hypothetical protein
MIENHYGTKFENFNLTKQLSHILNVKPTTPPITNLKWINNIGI